MGILRRAATAVAVLATPWLVFGAADAGGWTRFGVAVIVTGVASIYLGKELRDA